MGIRTEAGRLGWLTANHAQDGRRRISRTSRIATITGAVSWREDWHILELISLGAPLGVILNKLCVAIDVQIGNVVSLVLLPDGQEDHLSSTSQSAVQMGLSLFFSSTSILSCDEALSGRLEIYSCDPRGPTPQRISADRSHDPFGGDCSSTSRRGSGFRETLKTFEELGSAAESKDRRSSIDPRPFRQPFENRRHATTAGGSNPPKIHRSSYAMALLPLTKWTMSSTIPTRRRM